MFEEDEEDIEQLLAGPLTFTEKQIEYLKSEFERQRRWVKTLSEREAAALEELEDTRNSGSYRVGRAMTWPLRKIMTMFDGRSRRFFLMEKSRSGVSEVISRSMGVEAILTSSNSRSFKVSWIYLPMER